MPRPVYIIAADNVIEDRYTNLVAIVSVLERLTVHIQQPEKGHDRESPERPKLADLASTGVKWTAIAVWMRNPEENGRFEHQWVIIPPDGNEVPVGKPAEFEWTDPEKNLHRFRMVSRGVPPAKSSGVMVIESRVRKVGTERWEAQQFPAEIVLTGDAAEVLSTVEIQVESRPIAKGK